MPYKRHEKHSMANNRFMIVHAMPITGSRSNLNLEYFVTNDAQREMSPFQVLSSRQPGKTIFFIA
jgi:hypothetical protein